MTYALRSVATFARLFQRHVGIGAKASGTLGHGKARWNAGFWVFPGCTS